MNTETLIAVMTIATSLVGSLGGILISNKLTLYRIKKLEEKVDKHNNVIERTYVNENEIKNIKDRVLRLED